MKPQEETLTNDERLARIAGDIIVLLDSNDTRIHPFRIGPPLDSPTIGEEDIIAVKVADKMLAWAKGYVKETLQNKPTIGSITVIRSFILFVVNGKLNDDKQQQEQSQ